MHYELRVKMLNFLKQVERSWKLRSKFKDVTPAIGLKKSLLTSSLYGTVCIRLYLVTGNNTLYIDVPYYESDKSETFLNP